MRARNYLFQFGNPDETEYWDENNEGPLHTLNPSNHESNIGATRNRAITDRTGFVTHYNLPDNWEVNGVRNDKFLGYDLYNGNIGMLDTITFILAQERDQTFNSLYAEHPTTYRLKSPDGNWGRRFRSEGESVNYAPIDDTTPAYTDNDFYELRFGISVQVATFRRNHPHSSPQEALGSAINPRYSIDAMLSDDPRDYSHNPRWYTNARCNYNRASNYHNSENYNLTALMAMRSQLEYLEPGNRMHPLFQLAPGIDADAGRVDNFTYLYENPASNKGKHYVVDDWVNSAHGHDISMVSPSPNTVWASDVPWLLNAMNSPDYYQPSIFTGSKTEIANNEMDSLTGAYSLKFMAPYVKKESPYPGYDWWQAYDIEEIRSESDDHYATIGFINLPGADTYALGGYGGIKTSGFTAAVLPWSTASTDRVSDPYQDSSPSMRKYDKNIRDSLVGFESEDPDGTSSVVKNGGQGDLTIEVFPHVIPYFAMNAAYDVITENVGSAHPPTSYLWLCENTFHGENPYWQYNYNGWGTDSGGGDLTPLYHNKYFESLGVAPQAPNINPIWPTSTMNDMGEYPVRQLFKNLHNVAWLESNGAIDRYIYKYTVTASATRIDPHQTLDFKNLAQHNAAGTTPFNGAVEQTSLVASNRFTKLEGVVHRGHTAAMDSIYTSGVDITSNSIVANLQQSNPQQYPASESPDSEVNSNNMIDYLNQTNDNKHIGMLKGRNISADDYRGQYIEPSIYDDYNHAGDAEVHPTSAGSYKVLDRQQLKGGFVRLFSPDIYDIDRGIDKGEYRDTTNRPYQYLNWSSETETRNYFDFRYSELRPGIYRSGEADEDGYSAVNYYTKDYPDINVTVPIMPGRNPYHWSGMHRPNPIDSAPTKFHAFTLDSGLTTPDSQLTYQQGGAGGGASSTGTVAYYTQAQREMLSSTFLYGYLREPFTYAADLTTGTFPDNVTTTSNYRPERGIYGNSVVNGKLYMSDDLAPFTLLTAFNSRGSGQTIQEYSEYPHYRERNKPGVSRGHKKLHAYALVPTNNEDRRGHNTDGCNWWGRGSYKQQYHYRRSEDPYLHLLINRQATFRGKAYYIHDSQDDRINDSEIYSPIGYHRWFNESTGTPSSSELSNQSGVHMWDNRGSYLPMGYLTDKHYENLNADGTGDNAPTVEGFFWSPHTMRMLPAELSAECDWDNPQGGTIHEEMWWEDNPSLTLIVRGQWLKDDFHTLLIRSGESLDNQHKFQTDYKCNHFIIKAGGIKLHKGDGTNWYELQGNRYPTGLSVVELGSRTGDITPAYDITVWRWSKYPSGERGKDNNTASWGNRGVNHFRAYMDEKFGPRNNTSAKFLSGGLQPAITRDFHYGPNDQPNEINREYVREHGITYGQGHSSTVSLMPGAKISWTGSNTVLDKNPFDSNSPLPFTQNIIGTQGVGDHDGTPFTNTSAIYMYKYRDPFSSIGQNNHPTIKKYISPPDRSIAIRNSGAQWIAGNYWMQDSAGAEINYYNTDMYNNPYASIYHSTNFYAAEPAGSNYTYGNYFTSGSGFNSPRLHLRYNGYYVDLPDDANYTDQLVVTDVNGNTYSRNKESVFQGGLAGDHYNVSFVNSGIPYHTTDGAMGAASSALDDVYYLDFPDNETVSYTAESSYTNNYNNSNYYNPFYRMTQNLKWSNKTNSFVLGYSNVRVHMSPLRQQLHSFTPYATSPDGNAVDMGRWHCYTLNALKEGRPRALDFANKDDDLLTETIYNQLRIGEGLYPGNNGEQTTHSTVIISTPYGSYSDTDDRPVSMFYNYVHCSDFGGGGIAGVEIWPEISNANMQYVDWVVPDSWGTDNNSTVADVGEQPIVITRGEGHLNVSPFNGGRGHATNGYVAGATMEKVDVNQNNFKHKIFEVSASVYLSSADGPSESDTSGTGGTGYGLGGTVAQIKEGLDSDAEGAFVLGVTCIDDDWNTLTGFNVGGDGVFAHLITKEPGSLQTGKWYNFKAYCKTSECPAVNGPDGEPITQELHPTATRIKISVGLNLPVAQNSNPKGYMLLQNAGIKEINYEDYAFTVDSRPQKYSTYGISRLGSGEIPYPEKVLPPTLIDGWLTGYLTDGRSGQLAHYESIGSNSEATITSPVKDAQRPHINALRPIENSIVSTAVGDFQFRYHHDTSSLSSYLYPGQQTSDGDVYSDGSYARRVPDIGYIEGGEDDYWLEAGGLNRRRTGYVNDSQNINAGQVLKPWIKWDRPDSDKFFPTGVKAMWHVADGQVLPGIVFEDTPNISYRDDDQPLSINIDAMPLEGTWDERNVGTLGRSSHEFRGQNYDFALGHPNATNHVNYYGTSWDEVGSIALEQSATLSATEVQEHSSSESGTGYNEINLYDYEEDSNNAGPNATYRPSGRYFYSQASYPAHDPTKPTIPLEYSQHLQQKGYTAESWYEIDQYQSAKKAIANNKRYMGKDGLLDLAGDRVTALDIGQFYLGNATWWNSAYNPAIPKDGGNNGTGINFGSWDQYKTVATTTGVDTSDWDARRHIECNRVVKLRSRAGRTLSFGLRFFNDIPSVNVPTGTAIEAFVSQQCVWYIKITPNDQTPSNTHYTLDSAFPLTTKAGSSIANSGGVTWESGGNEASHVTDDKLYGTEYVLARVTNYDNGFENAWLQLTTKLKIPGPMIGGKIELWCEHGPVRYENLHDTTASVIQKLTIEISENELQHN